MPHRVACRMTTKYFRANPLYKLIYTFTVGVVYTFVFRAWWPWSTFEKSPRRFAAIFVWRPQHRGREEGARLGSRSLLLPPSSLPQCWRVPVGPLLRMPHTGGGETPRRFLKSRPQLSSPEYKIILESALTWTTIVIYALVYTYIMVNVIIYSRLHCSASRLSPDISGVGAIGFRLLCIEGNRYGYIGKAL